MFVNILKGRNKQQVEFTQVDDKDPIQRFREEAYGEIFLTAADGKTGRIFDENVGIAVWKLSQNMLDKHKM